MQKMLEETKEEEEQVQNEFEDIETDAEDTLEKFKAARKKVEEQLGVYIPETSKEETTKATDEQRRRKGSTTTACTICCTGCKDLRHN